MKIKIFLIAFLAFFATISFAQVEDPVYWSSKTEKVSDNIYKLIMSADIEDGWYIYGAEEYKGGPNGTAFTFDLKDGVSLKGELKPISEMKKGFDEIFQMEIGKFKGGKAVFEQLVKAEGSATITALVEWQACNDMNCLPPNEYEFTFKVGEGEAVAASNEAKSGEAVVSNSVAQVPQQSLWATILEAILWGFAALLTPCVFPMVPMTVSFFMKSSESKAKGRLLASVYGLSIVALYTLPIAAIIAITYFVGGDAVTADIFNWLATHWLPNVLFFIIFIIFAISFFGAFEIVLPSWLVNKSDTKADKGGLIGTFFMALTLVLVSFSCTGPIVGSILVQSTQGEVWSPIITMFAFSAAFALPFTLFAFFPSMLKSLPKSGGWLNSVKVVLGFIELALGLKFLSVADQTYHWGLLDREVYIALWIVIFTMLGLYFLGKIRFAHDSEEPYLKVKKLFLAIITFSFVVYLIPGMFGAPLKALSGYLPPMHTHDFNLTSMRSATAAKSNDLGTIKYGDVLHLPHDIPGFFDYDDAVEYAKKVGKPLFLDFTGHGCVNCREMEANVWSDSRVLQILSEDYVVVALYVDDKMQLPESEWVTAKNGKTLKTLGKKNAQFQVDKFGVNAQPYYVLVDPNSGEQLAPARGYDLSVEGFLEFLKNNDKL
ncbi:MAG: cytochrome c biogenesis protein CcdA [Rikenellaceae bacterium]